MNKAHPSVAVLGRAKLFEKDEEVLVFFVGLFLVLILFPLFFLVGSIPVLLGLVLLSQGSGLALLLALLFSLDHFCVVQVSLLFCTCRMKASYLSTGPHQRTSHGGSSSR